MAVEGEPGLTGYTEKKGLPYATAEAAERDYGVSAGTLTDCPYCKSQT